MGTVIPSGGCIRLYDTGPEWHINEDHAAIGLVVVSEPPTIDASGFLVIKLVDDQGVPNALPIVYMNAASDETLTANGISAGCSNGGPIIRIRFHKEGIGALNLNTPAHWDYVSGDFSNIWLTAQHWDPS